MRLRNVVVVSLLVVVALLVLVALPLMVAVLLGLPVPGLPWR